MLGQATLGTYVAYGAIILLLTAIVVVFLRFAVMVSLLLLSPMAAVIRRIRGAKVSR